MGVWNAKGGTFVFEGCEQAKSQACVGTSFLHFRAYCHSVDEGLAAMTPRTSFYRSMMCTLLLMSTIDCIGSTIIYIVEMASESLLSAFHDVQAAVKHIPRLAHSLSDVSDSALTLLRSSSCSIPGCFPFICPLLFLGV